MTSDTPTPTDVLHTGDIWNSADGITAIVAGSRSTVDDASDGGLGMTDTAVRLQIAGVFDTLGVVPDTIVSGTARGVDTIGEQYAKRRDIPVAQFEAPWDDTDHPDAVVRQGQYGTYDAAAGHRRNAWMAEFARAHGQRSVLVAILDFPSSGTESMIELARDELGDKNVFVVPVTDITDADDRRSLEPVLMDS